MPGEVRPEQLCIIVKRNAKVDRHGGGGGPLLFLHTHAVRLIEGIFCRTMKSHLHIFSD